MDKRRVAFIHTSPPAVGPLMQFYSAAAPELEITNLLDDGLLRLLAAQSFATTRARLAGMLSVAIETYRAELALVTCSSVPLEMVTDLGARAGVPIVKIDYPMMQQAVRAGRRVGIAATFPPTLGPTRRLLGHAAAEAGVEVEIVEEVAPAAYDALLTNDTALHDELLTAAVGRLAQQDVSTIVLAQVSMARTLPRLASVTEVPVLSSLHTSLAAVRAQLEKHR
ncbi:MAG: aspartate/glutamate racemase family protein [Pyrinomonadaceae bacterium]